MNIAIAATMPIGAYALGCVVGAYYLARWHAGQDIRTLGSGNAGARNAGRLFGPRFFAGTLAIDTAKGALVTAGAGALGAPPSLLSACIVLVVAGHVWPVQLGFRGGKGAATALGVLLVYDLRVAFVLAPIVLVLLAISRSLTVSGLATFAAAPIVAAYVGKSWPEVAGLATMAGIVIFAHRTK